MLNATYQMYWQTTDEQHLLEYNPTKYKSFGQTHKNARVII